jgi:hypothetical protein
VHVEELKEQCKKQSTCGMEEVHKTEEEGGGSTPQVFEQILATTKAIRLDLGLKMLKQNKGLYMVTNDGQTKCQEHPMKEEIQIGERRLELSPLLCE